MARAMRSHARGGTATGWRIAEVEARVWNVLGRLDDLAASGWNRVAVRVVDRVAHASRELVRLLRTYLVLQELRFVVPRFGLEPGVI